MRRGLDGVNATAPEPAFNAKPLSECPAVSFLGELFLPVLQPFLKVFICAGMGGAARRRNAYSASLAGGVFNDFCAPEAQSADVWPGFSCRFLWMEDGRGAIFANRA